MPRDPWLRAGILVWAAMVIAVCVRAGVQPQRSTLVPVWQAAGSAWIEGGPLYDADPAYEGRVDGFRYAPLSAAAFAPLAVMPPWLAGVVWRLLGAGLLLWAVVWWSRVGLPEPLDARRLGQCLLITAPLALGSLNNGQANAHLLALLLFAHAAISDDRPWLAGLMLALAFYLKVYPLAFALLLCVAFPRRLPLPLLASLLLLGLAPFLMQSPGYVAGQYRWWAELLSHNDTARRLADPNMGYRDLWHVLRVWELPLTLKGYMLLQLGGAALCAVSLGWLAWRGASGRHLSAAALLLGSIWSLLLGPAPESSTYVLIAPSLAWLLLATSPNRHPVTHYAAANVLSLLLVCAAAVAHPGPKRAFLDAGMQPLAVLWLCGGLLPLPFTWAPARPALLSAPAARAA
jgi:hypothetical protein